jgi:hemoglobin-like flavoprotein
MNMPNEAVIASYHRCRESDEFIDTFYDIFLARSPEIAQMFADTNFKIQKLMLRESLMEMLFFAQGMPGAAKEIEKLGRRHKQLGVKPEMFVIWLDSLCEAVERHDCEYTPELALEWRHVMQQGIDAMQAE